MQFLRFEQRWLTNLLKYGILTLEIKIDTGKLFSHLIVRGSNIFALDYRFKSGLTTPLTIYRVGLPGNNAHKSTRKHRFWTKKHQKCPEITQKITPNLFGTLSLQDRIFSPKKSSKSLETKRIQGFFVFPKITRTCLIFSF